MAGGDVVHSAYVLVPVYYVTSYNGLGGLCTTRVGWFTAFARRNARVVDHAVVRIVALSLNIYKKYDCCSSCCQADYEQQELQEDEEAH